MEESFDRKEAGPGPWQDELDSESWVDKELGFPCRIFRTPSTGSLCGYVGVERGHPFYATFYTEVDKGSLLRDRIPKGIRCDLGLEGYVDVHGGLTFSDWTDWKIKGFKSEHPIWWFGFDCAHYGDLSPGGFGILREGEYRDWGYTKQEVKALARQLKTISQGWDGAAPN